MKQNLLFTVLWAMMLSLSAQQPSVIRNVLEKSVEEKIASMQELIGFNDEQAQKLRDMELNFLSEVNKAEHCFMCNRKKRVEKLKKERDKALQTILERDQYIKYDAIENERIKKYPYFSTLRFP